MLLKTDFIHAVTLEEPQASFSLLLTFRMYV